MAEIVRIDENTWRFEDGFVRFFLLVGENEAAMIDSGANCPNALELARTLTDKPIMLINTHCDGDHTSGTADFAEIHVHPADYQLLGGAEKFPDTAPVWINDGDEIELGNRPLKIIYIPGHTAGSVAILDKKKRVLYSGDSVQKGHIFMFGKHREPEKFEVSLEKLVSLRPLYDCIYAAHDEFMVDGDYAAKVLDAWRRVRKGEVGFEMIDMFGNQVKSYTTQACGFFTE